MDSCDLMESIVEDDNNDNDNDHDHYDNNNYIGRVQYESNHFILFIIHMQ